MKYLVFLLLLLFSCNQQDEDIIQIPCEAENWGHLKVSNTQAENYEIFLSGTSIGTIEGLQSKVFEKITADTYLFQAVELNTANPTSYSLDNFPLLQCRTNEISF